MEREATSLGNIDAVTGDRPIVVYDGACRMCAGSIRMVRWFDWLGRFDTLPYTVAEARFPELTRGGVDAGLRVRFTDTSVTVGVNAVRSILVRTPVWALPALLLYVPGVHWLAGRVYAFVAAHRKRI